MDVGWVEQHSLEVVQPWPSQPYFLCPSPPLPPSTLHTLARLLSRSGRFMSGTEGLNSCERGGQSGSAYERDRTGRGGGATYIQQGGGVHAEAVARQHGLQVVQVGVHGVQVLTELGPGRRESTLQALPQAPPPRSLPL